MSKVIDLLRSIGVEVHTRAQWGSVRERAGSYAQRAATSGYQITGPVPYHFLHLSVTRDTDTVREGAAGAAQIEGYGYSQPPMVSYQMLVTNEGRVYEGQSYGVKGTHTVNDKGIAGFPHDLNRAGYAVALMQNVDDEVTDIQVEVVAACYAAAELAGYVRHGAPIYPHRMFAAKSCPGDKGYARLAEIQRIKDELVKSGMENDVSSTEVWDGKVPMVNDDGKPNSDQPAKWALAQARVRATRAEAAGRAAHKQAVQNGRAIAELAASLENLAPGIARRVVKALGDEVQVGVTVDVGALDGHQD